MKTLCPLEMRLAKYGTMSLALAAVSAPQAAHASVILFVAPPPGVSDSGGPIFFNALTGQVDLSPITGDYELSIDASGLKTKAVLGIAGATLLNSASLRNFAVSSPVGYPVFQSAARINSGATIGAALMFGAGNGTLASNSVHTSVGSQAFGHFNPNGADVNGFVGLEVLQGSMPEYGWANIVVHPDFRVTLNSFALQTDGSAIAATLPATGGGGAPEPASILLLALGAAGIAAYRRKREA